MDTPMLPVEPRLSHWQPAGHRVCVECTDEVIEQLRLRTREAELFPRERGTLWGIRDGDVIRIVGVARMMMPVTKQAAQPVGWFQVRLEPEMRLTAADLRYFEEHYSGPDKLAMILRPEKAGAARVGIFFPDADGRVPADSIHPDALIPGWPDPARKALEDAHAGRADSQGNRAARGKGARAARNDNRAAIQSAEAAAAAPELRRKWLAWSVAFGIGVIAGATALFAIQLSILRPPESPRAEMPAKPAAVQTARPSAPAGDAAVDSASQQQTRELTEKMKELQTELEQEKTHTRRLEVLLTLLRGQIKPPLAANSPVK